MAWDDSTRTVQQRLTTLLDELIPVDVRTEDEDRMTRVEQVARCAIREAKEAKLDQAKALSLLLRLWRGG